MDTKQNLELLLKLLNSRRLTKEERAAIISLLEQWEEDSGILTRNGIELPEI